MLEVEESNPEDDVEEGADVEVDDGDAVEIDNPASGPSSSEPLENTPSTRCMTPFRARLSERTIFTVVELRVTVQVRSSFWVKL